ncbi:LysR family transcriptional regulator [Parapusillimonas sp. SGNA-6]|nr:LysR family transcriptional regulator [Parapusillimonas sp. SGNA-6]
MEIRQFKYFVQIVEQGSLSRAATALYIAQPALSQQIAKLEAELGVKLLIRSVRGVIPTDAGNAFYKQAKSVLKQLNSMQDTVISLGNLPSGTVSVGLATSTAFVLGLPFIEAMREKLPSVRLELTESPSAYLAELVINGRIDVGVLFINHSMKGLSAQKLLTENLFLVGPKGSLGGTGDITLAEARQYPLMLPSTPNSLRHQVDMAFAERHLDYVIQTEINATHVLRNAICQGMGFSIMPWSAIYAEAARDTVDVRKVIDPELHRDVSICVSDVLPRSYATECVCELLVETITTLATEQVWKNIQLI